MKKKVTLNKDQQLYVIPCVGGYSCLGYDVLIDRYNSLAAELNMPELAKEKRGTMEAYKEYQKIVLIASMKNQATGWRSKSQLVPELIGLEGKRVEVITQSGEKNRFIVGKSMGFIPCHLEIKTKRSSGGGAVYGNPFKSVRVIENVR